MKATPHTSTNPGKRVLVTLRNGGMVEGRFVERLSRSVVIDTGTERTKIRNCDIRQFIVVKGGPRRATR